jgi:hypothetical protein
VTVRRGILLFLLVAGLVLFGIWFRHVMKIDSCLDRGGAWNYEAALCEGARLGG